MKRREFITLFGGAAAMWPRPLSAQQAAKVPRIGFLGLSSPSGSGGRLEALLLGLREFGYVERQNIVIESRWAEGKYDRLPKLATELVAFPVDVLVTQGTPGTLAAKRATATIPIVMGGVGDAIGSRLIASLNRPGGNVTGTTFFLPELMAKRLELLKEVIPRSPRPAVLLNSDYPGKGLILEAMEVAAKSLKMEIGTFETRGPDEFKTVFATIVKGGFDAVIIQEDPMLIANANRIADGALEQGLPTIGFNELVKKGGLIGYGVNFLELFRETAYFVDKILKGAEPADLPVRRPTKFELVINLKTAKALGIEVPPMLLARADEVIE